MNLKKQIMTFLDQEEISLEGHKLSIIREDGILVYSSQEQDHSTAVLATGLWQAATQIAKIEQVPHSKGNTRLSFDQSSLGIYMLDLSIYKKDYILLSSYDHIINPGKHKLRMRLLRDKLENYLSQCNNFSNVENKSDFLFQNISDHEIENLFSQVVS